MSSSAREQRDEGRVSCGQVGRHKLPRVAVVTLAAILDLAALAAPATAEPVALTFDDLPVMALDGTPWNAAQTTRRLLAGLHRHRFPAIGFVTGEPMEGA